MGLGTATSLPAAGDRGARLAMISSAGEREQGTLLEKSARVRALCSCPSTKTAATGAFLLRVARTLAAAGASYPARPPISAFRIADSTSAACCPSASPPKRDERAASDGSEGGAVDRSHKLDL